MSRAIAIRSNIGTVARQALPTFILLIAVHANFLLGATFAANDLVVVVVGHAPGGGFAMFVLFAFDAIFTPTLRGAHSECHLALVVYLTVGVFAPGVILTFHAGIEFLDAPELRRLVLSNPTQQAELALGAEIVLPLAVRA